MRIDELHKFSDGTLDDVRTALNDRLKGIRMEYLPQTFWSQRDKANARAMIQAIDKRLKTRRIMRSLERFVGGRPYGERRDSTRDSIVSVEVLRSILQFRRFLPTNPGEWTIAILPPVYGYLFYAGYLKMVVEEVPEVSSVKFERKISRRCNIKAFQGWYEPCRGPERESQVHKLAKLQDGVEIVLG
ncbi:hypothetical protein Tco_0889518 [Tanacetum coccineum]